MLRPWGFPRHHHPIITQGDELIFMRPPSWVVLGIEPDERREIAPDGQFAASPGLSRPYPTRLAFGTGAIVARMVTLYQAVDMGVA